MTNTPSDQLVEVMCDLEAITDILHGLGTAAISGDFIIKGCGIKFLATNLAAVGSRIGAIREVMGQEEA